MGAEKDLGVARIALSAAGALGASVLLSGCFLFQKVVVEPFAYQVSGLSPEEIAQNTGEADALYRSPRTPERVEKSYQVALGSISPSNGYSGLWRSARAAAWLADHLPEADLREFYAHQGIAAGREAIRLAPEPAESHYYLALSLGRLSKIKKTPEFIEEMAREAEKALQIDERFDRAGPHRFLGLLHLRTQDQPFIGFGDLDVALEHLERAVELFPGDAENRLAYAEVLIEDEDYEAARKELDAALASKPPGDYEAEHRQWLQEAKELKEKIRGR